MKRSNLGFQVSPSQQTPETERDDGDTKTGFRAEESESGPLQRRSVFCNPAGETVRAAADVHRSEPGEVLTLNEILTINRCDNGFNCDPTDS